LADRGTRRVGSVVHHLASAAHRTLTSNNLSGSGAGTALQLGTEVGGPR
jgi:hypothetical protein